MDGDKVCQSCGKSLLRPVEYGRNNDGSLNSNYCHYCFQNGTFSEPSITLPQMITKTIDRLKTEKNMTDEEANNYASSYIPSLERWKKNPSV